MSNKNRARRYYHYFFEDLGVAGRGTNKTSWPTQRRTACSKTVSSLYSLCELSSGYRYPKLGFIHVKVRSSRNYANEKICFKKTFYLEKEACPALFFFRCFGIRGDWGPSLP